MRINGHVAARFPFIPLPLDYILPELLKNAMRSVMCSPSAETRGLRLLGAEHTHTHTHVSACCCQTQSCRPVAAFRATMENHLNTPYNVPDVAVTIANNDIDFVIR